MKYEFVVVLMFGLVLTAPLTGAKLIENPEAVSYMHTIVSKSGSVSFEPVGPFPRVESLHISLSIPQDTYSQKVKIIDVEGPDDYNISRDKWGNEVMELMWNSPDTERVVHYNVSFDVKTYQKSGVSPSKSFPLTELTEPTPEIKKTAYTESYGLNGTPAMLALASWVYQAVDYQMGYEGLQKSAKWVFENRKAVCDGHSNLLISMLRSVGYNAYYVVGYAYTERTPGRYFGPHGWVEAEYDGKIVTIDPTWLESPVDATHIKFSNAPDSNYSEYIWAMSNNVKIHWKRDEPSITLIEKKEEPRISIKEDIIPETAPGGGYAIIIANVSSLVEDRCVLGRIEALSCSRKSGSAFLDIEERNKTLLFCGEGSVFWFMGIPEAEKNMVYTCPVTVSGGGAIVNKSVVVKSFSSDVSVRLDTQKVLLRGEMFNARTVVENRGFDDKKLTIYLSWNGKLYEKEVNVKARESKEIVWKMKSPIRAGKYGLRVFSSSGDMEEEVITVSDRRKIRILDVSVPSTIELGKPIYANISVLGLENTVGEIIVRIGEKEERRVFSIENGEEKVFVFSSGILPEGMTRMSIDVFSSDNRYEDGIVTTITITHEKNWLERLIEKISDIFKWLLSIVHLG